MAFQGRCATLIAVVLMAPVTGSPLIGSPSEASSRQSLSDLQVGELQAIVNEYGDVFGGLWADPSSGVVTVYVVPGSSRQDHHGAGLAALAAVGSSIDPKASTFPKRWNMTVVSGGPSLASLRAIEARIPTEEPWASDAGTRLVQYFIDPRAHSVVIGMTEITPKLVSEAQTSFGSRAKLIVVDRPVLQDRLYDSQPYYGSDRLVDSNTLQCTTGFAAYDPSASNHRGMLTAGHCWPIGKVVTQGYYNGSIHISGNMGKVTHRVAGNSGPDGEFMDSAATGTSVDDQVWYGSNPPNGAVRVAAQGISFVGLGVCVDGSMAGENCNAVVDYTEICIYFTGIGWDCNLDQADATNGSRLGQNGDSAAPVVANHSGGGVNAYGTIAGGNSGGTTEWYTDINDELNALGVRLLVN